ncbi:hypothetical protein CHS0354_023810 [Potamilus streckersoni]|uniref:Malonyl-CoA:ACP transacylase (MAT) domain-containing protein n=1 Tax=Potamilus streckersoni TaxID=2493646 RepID=A0AAE0VLR6_9BIVA|nr:hypothetical protein CHS0354_023810 [Potamilus streckersoni]
MDTSDEWIVERTGIRERRYLKDPTKATAFMCANVVKSLLEKSNTDPSEIDLIIVATVTPDMMFPSTACLVQSMVGANNAWGFDINAACSGFLFALVTGAKHIESGACKKVLVLGGDKMTSILNMKDRTTAIIFGDGAGGVLLEPSENGYGLMESNLHMDGMRGRDALYMPAGGSLNPASEETVRKRMHSIFQDGQSVFRSAVVSMSSSVMEMLSIANLKISDVDYVVPHQANLRIINATADRLGIPLSKIGVNIQKYGNTTAGTIPIMMSELDEEGKLKKGDNVILVSFGAGQGSQYIGMGKDLYETYSECKSVIKNAEKILGYSISEIMFSGADDILSLTKYTQPAIFLHSYLVSMLKNEKNVGIVAGHSLGEYSALCFSGVLTFEDTLRIVNERGKIMQNSADKVSGSMAAVVGGNEDDVQRLVTECSKSGLLVIANYNAPGQVVVSGETEAVEKLVSMGKQFGAKLVKKLNVSGAFHSPLMQLASDEFKQVLKDVKIVDSKIPICMNVSAKMEIRSENIRSSMEMQMVSPVLWTQSVLLMKEKGAKTYYEFGPQKVLGGLIKRIHAEAEILSIDTLKDIQ